MKSIAKWEIVQLDFPIKVSCKNPFLDVELSVMFNKGDLRYTIDGFYDGMEDDRSIWRVRFAPMEEGDWYYETSSNIGELNNITGTFVCTIEESKGGLVCSNKYPNWFFRQSGEPVLIVNDGWYPHPANGHWISYEDVDYQQPSEKDMEDFIDLLSDNGVNLFIDMGQLYARQRSVTDISFQWP